MPESARISFDWDGDKIRGATHDGAVAGVRIAAEHLLGESRQLVPIEEGTLERSGTVDVDDASESASVSYDTPYAVYQHERLDLKHDEGRQAKYLEQPFITEQETLQELIAAEIRRRLS